MTNELGLVMIYAIILIIIIKHIIINFIIKGKLLFVNPISLTVAFLQYASSLGTRNSYLATPAQLWNPRF